uniref:TEA domain-containing protein n=1 Tax=Acrobeloides nanus TaxID=290746 RepID=A0A914E689_9BILA
MMTLVPIYDNNFYLAEEIWSKDVEEAFIEAIQIYGQDGSTSVPLSDGKRIGKNKLISDYILEKTNKYRSPRQISSHIQVYKIRQRSRPSSRIMSPMTDYSKIIVPGCLKNLSMKVDVKGVINFNPNSYTNLCNLEPIHCAPSQNFVSEQMFYSSEKMQIDKMHARYLNGQQQFIKIHPIPVEEVNLEPTTFYTYHTRSTWSEDFKLVLKELIMLNKLGDTTALHHVITNISYLTIITDKETDPPEVLFVVALLFEKSQDSNLGYCVYRLVP